MSRSINPLLFDAQANAAQTPRNFARTAQPVSGPTFDQQLAVTGAQNAAKVEPTAKAAASPDTTAADAGGTDSIKPASSWRVDRSAAEVGHDVEDFGWDDLLDVLNPLQHIPVLGTIYREMTGDTIKPVARVAGDVLFGAVTGSLIVSGIVSAVSAAYEQQTGEEPAMQVADALFGIKSSNAAAPTMLAEADVPAGPVPPPEEETTKLAEAAPVAPVPVQTASLDGKESIAAAPAATQAVSKQPFGGVMDTGIAAKNQPSEKVLAAATHVQGVRIGNTIYTNPLMNAAARVKTLQAAKAQAPAPAEPVSAPDAAPDAAQTETVAQAGLSVPAPPPSVASMSAPSAALSIPGTSPSGDKTLGKMMHNSATATSAGHALPPDLVRDMMLMALDKYKTAGNLAPSEINLGVPN
ncbi:MAG: hypothetical protein PHY92_01765 [Alphaproteobacteria bacterium]|nr:hypothetical protein [Alphaproteobacteria bacterium]